MWVNIYIIGFQLLFLIVLVCIYRRNKRKLNQFISYHQKDANKYHHLSTDSVLQTQSIGKHSDAYAEAFEDN